MSDPYRVIIPAANDAAMSAWDIPAEVRQIMESRLREQLAVDPIRHLIRAISPWGEPLNLFAFTVPDADNPDRTHMFQFHVLYGNDEESLIVADVGYQRRDRNLPGSGPGLPTS